MSEVIDEIDRDDLAFVIFMEDFEKSTTTMPNDNEPKKYLVNERKEKITKRARHQTKKFSNTHFI